MLRIILPSEIQNYTRTDIGSNFVKIPRSVKTVCPFCETKTNFKLAWSRGWYAQMVNHVQIECPSCKKSSLFVFIDRRVHENEFNCELFIAPMM